MTISLEVTKRTGSAAAARAAGQVPAVVYGPKQEPIAIAVDKGTLVKTFEEAGESTIVTLTGLDQEIETLVHDVAFDAARGGVEHADFYAIERGKELTTNVALEFIGEAPVTKGGATVNKVLHEVEVTCRPSALPSQIEVDLSVLVDEESHITVADLNVPEGVTIEDEPEALVANVAAAREEEPEEAPDEEASEEGATEAPAEEAPAE